MKIWLYCWEWVNELINENMIVFVRMSEELINENMIVFVGMSEWINKLKSPYERIKSCRKSQMIEYEWKSEHFWMEKIINYDVNMKEGILNWMGEKFFITKLIDREYENFSNNSMNETVKKTFKWINENQWTNERLKKWKCKNDWTFIGLFNVEGSLLFLQLIGFR